MEFEVEEGEIKDLHTLVFDDYSGQWAEFILANRNNSTGAPVHDYDIVMGPIANDRVGVQLWKYEKQMMKDDMVAKLAMYVCSNGAYGCDYRETKFVNLNRKRR